MLYIIMGKSAAGKDKIFKLIVKLRLAKPIVLVTTRPPRKNEIEGVDYYFKDRSTFANMIKAQEFVEYRSYITAVNGVRDEWFYGTLRDSIDPSIDQVIVLPPEGHRQIVNAKQDFEYKTILVTASDEVRLNRAKQRGSFDEAEWNRRLVYDNIDFKFAKEIADVLFENNQDLSDENLIERIKTEIFENKPGTPSDVKLTPMMLRLLEKVVTACNDVKQHVYDDGLENGTSGILVNCDKLVEQIEKYIGNN